MSKVKIRVENTYGDGHNSIFEYDIDPPEGLTTEQLDDWWENEVWQQTGDGHDTSGKLGSCYEVTILDAPFAFTDLIGQTREWID